MNTNSFVIFDSSNQAIIADEDLNVKKSIYFPEMVFLTTQIEHTDRFLFYDNNNSIKYWNCGHKKTYQLFENSRAITLLTANDKYATLISNSIVHIYKNQKTRCKQPISYYCTDLCNFANCAKFYNDTLFIGTLGVVYECDLTKPGIKLRYYEVKMDDIGDIYIDKYILAVFNFNITNSDQKEITFFDRYRGVKINNFQLDEFDTILCFTIDTDRRLLIICTFSENVIFDLLTKKIKYKEKSSPSSYSFKLLKSQRNEPYIYFVNNNSIIIKFNLDKLEIQTLTKLTAAGCINAYLVEEKK